MEDKKLIFILDDDPLYLELLKAHLKKYDFTIELYNNAKLCLDNLYKKPFLLILDFNLNDSGTQDYSGKEVFHKITLIDPKVKIVMISNQDSGRIVLELIQSGLRDYIEKDSKIFQNLDEIITSIMQS